MMRSNTIGRVPPVTFVKDKTYAMMQEVERLLQVAELPVSHGKTTDDAKTDNLDVDLPNEYYKSDKKFDDKNEKSGLHTRNMNESSSIANEKLTDQINIRQDLYGLNHKALMQKITNMKSSSRHSSQQPVNMDSLTQTDSFFDDVRKFGKTFSGKSRTENLKKYSQFFQQQKTSRERQSYNVTDFIRDTEVNDDVSPVDKFNEPEIEYEYYLESGNREDFSDTASDEETDLGGFEGDFEKIGNTKK